jgi:hypothetical protein
MMSKTNCFSGASAPRVVDMSREAVISTDDSSMASGTASRHRSKAARAS